MFANLNLNLLNDIAINRLFLDIPTIRFVLKDYGCNFVTLFYKYGCNFNCCDDCNNRDCTDCKKYIEQILFIQTDLKDLEDLIDALAYMTGILPSSIIKMVKLTYEKE